MVCVCQTPYLRCRVEITVATNLSVAGCWVEPFCRYTLIVRPPKHRVRGLRTFPWKMNAPEAGCWAVIVSRVAAPLAQAPPAATSMPQTGAAIAESAALVLTRYLGKLPWPEGCTGRVGQ